MSEEVPSPNPTEPGAQQGGAASAQVGPKARKGLFLLAMLLCLSPAMGAPQALLLGLVLALTIGDPFPSFNQRATNWLLKASVVGLGFGMNLEQALTAGREGLLFTVASIGVTLLAGRYLGRRLGVERISAFLISSGTAICGGSAIAAVSPIVNADRRQMTVALGTVFILNSVALLVFPLAGHLFGMSQHQFGLWCAIAIHDTSSVVGAGAAYGEQALQMATTVKLQRALWIIPLSLGTAVLMKTGGSRVKIPWFIGLFMLAMVASHHFPQYADAYAALSFAAKRGLTLTLFLIGASLSLATMRAVGIKPMVLGVLLWLLISLLSLAAILLEGPA
ncbi:MAG: putative sulfate exporter family transporter [Flavobacteriales bacterium]|nr:putative sulfate exporter family transporter [Flavobacteriales bacterium]